MAVRDNKKKYDSLMLVRLTKSTTPDERRIVSLTIGQVYIVIGIEADDYRIVNDHNDPCLYDPTCFELIDATEPEFWECETVAEGERYCYPHEFSQPGFFEDYHDGVPEVVSRFWAFYQKLYTPAKRSSR